MKNCPHCNAQVEDLIQLEAGMKLAVKAGGTEEPPDAVCAECYSALTTNVSRGVRLRAEQKAREKNKVMLWKSRVSILRQARQLMNQKAYSEAAVAYEKYLRIVEIAHDIKPGALTPDVFNRSSRSKELAVIASVYWDLVRIYDSSPATASRMKAASDKLIQFLPLSPFYTNITKKIEAFSRTAKNTKMAKELMRRLRLKRAKCFIATSVFGPESSETRMLRQFRDEKLKTFPLGRKFILIYYRISPGLAALSEKQTWLKPPMRLLLRFVAGRLRKKG